MTILDTVGLQSVLQRGTTKIRKPKNNFPQHKYMVVLIFKYLLILCYLQFDIELLCTFFRKIQNVVNTIETLKKNNKTYIPTRKKFLFFTAVL